MNTRTTGTRVGVTDRLDVLAQFASPQFRDDPVPLLRWLRENEPVHRTTKGFYLISTYADASWLSDNSRDLVLRPERDRMIAELPAAVRHKSMEVMLGSMVMSNPPEHTRLRRSISRDFTPRRVDGLRGQIAHVAGQTLDSIAGQLSDGAIVDLHHAWSLPLTLQVMSELLGVPDSDRGWLGSLIIDISDGTASGDEAKLAVADKRTATLADYFESLVVQKRASPSDDLVTAVAKRYRPDGPFVDSDLFGILWLLWLAGFESSATMLDHGALTMMNRPDDVHWLRGGYQKSLAFADEVLRHCVVQLFTPIPRIAAQDLEISGVRIPAGSDLRPLVAAANRDPERFPDPDRFDPARDNAVEAFTFGQGLHRCLGAFLARAELAIGLSLLDTRFPALVAAGALVMDPKIVTTRMTRSFPVGLERQSS
jgi:cytochrome P450 family 114